jgi:adenosine 3'-phospho 5'-phosphosulfate transporter B2
MLPHFDGDRPRIMHLLACFSGIMIFFLVYGLTQEKIMTTSYDETGKNFPVSYIYLTFREPFTSQGSDGGRFKDTAFLVFINRIVSIMVSLIIMIWLKPEPLRPSVPLHFYGIISISNFLSTFCQYEALKYVTFPIQTLGKCAKMIPVLVIGTITGRKQYSWREYLIGIVVMCGCFIFLTTGVRAAYDNCKER